MKEKVKIYDRIWHFKNEYEALDTSLLEARFEMKLHEMLRMKVDILKWNRSHFLRLK